MEKNELFEIELVEDTSLEASRVPISVAPSIGGGDDDGGGGQSNSNSSNNAADMP